MNIFFTLILFYLLNSSIIAYSFTDNTLTSSPLQQQQQQQLDSHSDHVSSRLDDIQIPEYVTKLHLKNGKDEDRLTSKDHSPMKAISTTSYRVCLSIQGEKGASACSFLLSGRPWRLWQRKVYQTTIDNSIRYYTVFNNWFVKNVIHNSIDCSETLLWKINDWRQVPSLEWYLLKAKLSAYVYRIDETYMDWKRYLRNASYKNNTDNNRIDKHRKHINLDHHDLEPDNEGCYHDIFGTTLCVGEQSLLDDAELKDQMNTLFEAMTYEDRTHMLRFQQRFIQWATKTSTMTANAVDQAQSIWFQRTQSAYQFLDDALNLVPSCTNISNHQGRQSSLSSSIPLAATSFYHALPSIVPETAAETTCPNIVFPFSVSPFDTSLGASFFSFRHSLPLRHRSFTSSCTPPTRSFLKLLPTPQKQWSTCINNNQKEHTGLMTSKQYLSLLSRSRPLEHYNRVQYHYMLSRLEKDMMKRLERLEKETLQEYYRAMVSAPHIWRINYHRHQQPHHDQRQEQEQRQRPGYTTQRLYQQLRLYTTISFRQLYTKSIQQLMEASRRYDSLVMEQVKQAHQEWKWVEQQRQNQIHDHQYHTLKEQHGQDVDYDAQCQQWWRKNKPWRFIHLLSSVAEQLGYYHHYNKSKTNSMDEDDYTLLSAIATYIPSAQDPPFSVPTTNSRAAIYISQRADMAIQVHRKMVMNQWTTAFQEINRRSQSMWVSAMDQVQGRHRLLPGCNATCAFGILMVKLVVLAVFLLVF